MSKDIKQIKALRAIKKSAIDSDDLNNEITGQNTGRQSRFGIEHAKGQFEIQKQRDRDTLQNILLNDALQIAYETAIRTLHQTQEIVYEALIDASGKLEISQQNHDTLLKRASTLPEGTRVFLDDDGTTYTEQGRALSEDEFLEIDWQEDSPSWETFKKSRDELVTAQKRYNDIAQYNTRVEEITDEINKASTQQELQVLTDELNDITNDINGHRVEAQYHPEPVSLENVPTLKF